MGGGGGRGPGIYIGLAKLDAKIFKKFDDCRLQNKERNSAVRRIKIFQIWIGKSS